MSDAHRSTRLVALRSVRACIAVTLLAAPGTALTVFDFDDFPPPGVATTDYGCDGKSFCSETDTFAANDLQVGLDSLSHTRNGIEAVFTSSHVLSIGPFEATAGENRFLEGFTDMDLATFTAFSVDFSTRLTFVEVDLAQPIFVDDGQGGLIEEFTFLEVWSDPGATGSLLARVELPASEAPSSPFVTLALAAPAGESFRSVRFGDGLPIPGCESGCSTELPGAPTTKADNLGVSPIPEPGAALLFAVGLGVTQLALRARPVRPQTARPARIRD